MFYVGESKGRFNQQECCPFDLSSLVLFFALHVFLFTSVVWCLSESYTAFPGEREGEDPVSASNPPNKRRDAGERPEGVGDVRDGFKCVRERLQILFGVRRNP